MATTQNTFTGNGSTTTFAFTFPYIEESDVKVSLDAVDQTTGFSVDTTNIVFDTAPASGVAIRIYRDTNVDQAAATFFSGSAIRAQDLNDNVNQNLYVNQELRNRTALTTGSTITGDYIFADANIQFEGSTDDDHETTLTVTDPTADRTIKLPNQSGTVPVLAADSNTAITATPEELNILDGVTATAAELNTMDGITATTAELNIMDGVTASTAELNLMDGVTATTGELNILDGVTATTAELNLMDGVTATTAELNHVDGVTSAIQTQLDNKQPLDAELTELATMGTNTAAALADLTQAEVQILDGATLSTAELNFVDGVTSDIQTQIDGKQNSDAELTELATMASTTASALADLTQAEVEILDGATVTTTELNLLDGVTASTAELNLLDGVTATTAELNKLDGVTASTTELNALDGITSTVTELNLLDGVTATTAELNILDGVTATASELNQLDGNTLSSSSTDFTSSSQYPSAAEIDARITARIDPIGGFEAIADRESFPDTAPAEGVLISVANANGLTVSSSGVSTNGDTLNDTTVTINNFPSGFNSTTLDDGIGLLVIATSTAHTYNFHRVVAKNEDVRQLSSDINDFKARYRVGASNPTTSLDEGDLFYNTGSDKMLVYDGSAWEEVQSIGEYFIIPATELADFASGSASTEVISNAPANASQIILSINGVIQEPNSGSSAPTDGFALDGSTIRLSATPPNPSEVWGVIIGSTVNIGTPSADTVGPTQLQDTAVTAGSYTLSSITVDDQGRITAASSGSVEADKIEEGNTAVEVVDTGSYGHITFDTEGSEKARFDTNGRLLIGYTANTTPAGYDHKVQITGTNGNTSSLSLTSNAGASVHNEPSITFGKTRGTAGGAANAISGGDTIGTIQFAAGDGTDVASIAANIKCSADGSVSGNDMPGRLVFSTTADGAATPTERMRIDSSGNVGIGTTSPQSLLHVHRSDSTYSYLNFTNSTTGSASGNGFQVGIGNDEQGTLWQFENNFMRFGTNNTERMRIDSSGRLLLGTSSTPTNSSALFVVQGLAGNANEQGTMRLQRGNNNGNNNRIGVIEFGGSDSAAAEIRGVGDGTWASNDYPGRLEFRTTPDGDSTTDERMRITSGGAVGINSGSNTTQAQTLRVAGHGHGSGNGSGLTGSTDPSIYFTTGSVDNSGSVNPIGMKITGGAGGTPRGCVLGVYGHENATNAHAFYVKNVGSGPRNGGVNMPFTAVYRGPTDSLRFPSSWSQHLNNQMMTAFGVYDVATSQYDGTVRAGIQVQLAGTYGGGSYNNWGGYCYTAKIDTNFGSSSNGTNYGYYANITNAGSGNNWGVYIANGGAAKPGGGSWSSTSDERVKTVNSSYTRGLTEIAQLNPVNFTYNGKAETPTDGKEYVGLIAQEVQPIIPDMIDRRLAKLEESDEEETEILMVDSSELVYALVNACKELKSEVDTLKTKIAALEGGE